MTVNVGLRYQTANVPEGMFGAATPQIAAAGVPGDLRPDRNDFAPRFGVAYSPKVDTGWKHRLLGESASVFRAGYGIGYGLVYDDPAILMLTNNYPWNSTRTVDRAELTNAYPVSPSRQAPGFNPSANFTNFASDAKNPTSHFYSASMQREFRRQYVLELGYLGSRSYHLFVSNEHNPAILTPEQAGQVIATRNSNSIPSRQQRSLHPEWRQHTFNDAFGFSKYNAGYVRLDRRFTGGLLIGANYTWSANLGVGETNNVRVQSTDNFRSDYARTSIDVPHRFALHYVWQTPGKRIYSGWRISGLSEWQSGRPFSILTGVDSNGDGISSSDRPDLNPAEKLSFDPTTGDWRSFTSPIDGTGRFITPLTSTGSPLLNSMPYGGNLGRNTFRGPSFSLWNLSLMKPFHITEHVQLELRADANNLFNHRNYGPPENMMNSANFGRNLTTPPSRSVLLVARLRF